MLNRLPNRYRFPAIAVLTYIAVMSVERFVLAILAYGVNSEYPGEFLLSFPVGLLQDFGMAILLATPFVWGLHHFQGFFRRKWASLLAQAMLLGFLWVLFFSNASAVFFWNEFDSRFNGIAVNYLLFPREVIGNIHQSFNLNILLPPVILLTLAVFGKMRQGMLSAFRDEARASNLRFYAIILPVFLMAGVTVAAAPMRIGDSRQANELANNGYYSFLRAAWTNDTAYDGIYPGMDEARAVAMTRAMVSQDNTRFLTPEGTRSLLRHVDNGSSPKKLNVVLVLNESFGSTFVDDIDNNRDEIITPNLTRLAKDGLLFTNIYATGVRTVRGLEAIQTSFTPIPGISTSRRPGSVGMNSLPYLFRDMGYQTSMLYGGRALFDNMGKFWSNIGYDHLWDQGDIEDIGFTTIWGAADEYIYGEALKRMDGMSEKKSPFFMTILSISNHRPYTYPLGRIDKDPADKRIENAATYADWAFGDFVEKSRGKPWFDDTVFIFVADHGPRLSGAAQVPVDRYRIPLLYYAPKHIKYGRVPTYGSNLDVGPTLLGLLGISFDSPFFGIDLMRVPEGKGRVIMSHNYSIAYGEKGRVATMIPKGTPRGYKMLPGDAPLVPEEAPDPELVDKAVALTQTAHRMFYNGEYHWDGRKGVQTVGK